MQATVGVCNVTTVSGSLKETDGTHVWRKPHFVQHLMSNWRRREKVAYAKKPATSLECESQPQSGTCLESLEAHLFLVLCRLWWKEVFTATILWRQSTIRKGQGGLRNKALEAFTLSMLKPAIGPLRIVRDIFPFIDLFFWVHWNSAIPNRAVVLKIISPDLFFSLF